MLFSNSLRTKIVTVRYISRSANLLAHSLAKTTDPHSDPRAWDTILRSCVYDLIST